MASKSRHRTRECDERLTRVFGLLGKRWSGVILGLLLEGPAHFAVIARAIPGISERMLSDRLTELAKARILDREVVPGPPIRVVYRLTEKGRALGPGLLKLGEWAERHLDRPPQRKPVRSPSRPRSKRPAPVKSR